MCLTLAVIFLAGLRAGGGGGGGCGGGYRVSHGYTKLSRLGGGYLHSKPVGNHIMMVSFMGGLAAAVAS